LYFIAISSQELPMITTSASAGISWLETAPFFAAVESIVALEIDLHFWNADPHLSRLS